MLLWQTEEEQSYFIFILAVNFAFINCIATGQIRSLYGICFNSKGASLIGAAYSAAGLFQTMGIIFGSSLSIYVCADIKIYVYLLLAAISLLSYSILYLKNRQRKEVDD
jgi:hypothetical protein